MDEAVQASPDPAGPLNPVPAQRARLLLAQGDVDGAARWTKENGLRAEDEPRYTSEPDYLVLARVLLAPGPARSGATAAAPGIVEPLTCRELEVLGMLAAGQSNQAIASQLVVTWTR